MADDRRQTSWKKTDWRGAGDVSATAANSNRRPNLLRYVILAIALAIIGTVAGLFLFIGKKLKPNFLTISIAEYKNRSLPPTAWAKQDGSALRELFGADGAEGSQERDLILRELAQLADRTATSAEKKRPVIVHLSAHAVVRRNTVYILTGFSQPDNEAAWLPLSDILDMLRRCQGECLLLLDVARPIADAGLGFLEENAGTFILAELTKQERDNKLPFLVLTSCGEGEVSRVSMTLRRSLFGYFVEQGLRGHADGWGDDKNGHVTARELAAYVKAHVAEWAAQARLPAQTPTLIGGGKDFVLITPPPRPSTPALPDASEDYPEWLFKAWQARDQWRADGSWRDAPRTFRHLETSLLRAEQRWLSGDDVDSIQKELETQFKALEAQRRKFAPANHPTYSLAQVHRRERKDEPELAQRMRPLTDRLQSKTPLMAGELDMIWQKLFEKPLEPPLTDVAALIVFRTLAEIPDSTRDQLKSGADAIAKLQPRPRHLEIQLLQLLVDLDPAQWKRWDELPGVAHLVLKTGQLAEQIGASDARFLPWLRDELATADAARREGVFQLAVGEAEARRQGKHRLEDALKRYQMLLMAVESIERGWLQLEDAFHTIAAVISELGRMPPDPVDQQLWQALVQSTHRLARLLATPAPASTAPIKEMESLTQDIAVQVRTLHGRYSAQQLDRHSRRLEAPFPPSPDELIGHLRSPIWQASLRAKLFAVVRDYDRVLAKNCITRTAQLTSADPSPTNSGKLRDAPEWRARLALDQLKLNGISDVTELEPSIFAEARSGKRDAWQYAGAKLRSAQTEALESFKASKSLAQQERAGWFIGADELEATSTVTSEPFSREPAVELRRQQRRELWHWLSEERYLKDAATFLKITTRSELTAYGRALNEVGRDLPSRAP